MVEYFYPQKSSSSKTMGSSATLFAFAALALLILVLPSPTNADVIGDAIKDSITTGISNMFVGAFNLAVTTVKNTAAWIFQKIVGYFKNLTSNMIASLARAWPMAKELVSSGANDNLKDTLNSLREYKNQFMTKLVLDTMYTGELPEEWNLKPLNLDDEIEHLEKLLSYVFYLSIFTGVLVCVLAVPNLVLFFYCRNLKVELRKVTAQRKQFLQKVAKREKNKPRKAKQEKRIEDLRANIIRATF